MGEHRARATHAVLADAERGSSERTACDAIARVVVGRSPLLQASIDGAMSALPPVGAADGVDADGATVWRAVVRATSAAVCRAGAAAKGVPLYEYLAGLAGRERPLLPVPCFRVAPSADAATTPSSGGGARRDCVIHADGARSFSAAMRVSSELYRAAAPCGDDEQRAPGRQRGGAAADADAAFAALAAGCETYCGGAYVGGADDDEVLQPDRIATVSEAVEWSAARRQRGRALLTVSHQPGEPDDAFAAELAVGLNAARVEFAAVPCGSGALCEGNSWLCRFHQFRRVEAELGGEWSYEENYYAAVVAGGEGNATLRSGNAAGGGVLR